MVISAALKYAFVSTVKGGTNSLYQVLVERFQGERYGDFHCSDVSRIPTDWFLFTTCRNPYSRAVSIWYSTCMRGKDRYAFRQMCPQPDRFEVFAEWAASMQCHLEKLGEAQRQLLLTQSARHGDIPFQRILRVENLEQEFNSLPFVGNRCENLPRLNPTQGQREVASEYLTDRAQAAVRIWMEADFDRYGYSREVTSLGPREHAA